YEFRNIQSRGNPDEDREILDSIQWAISKDQYGIPPSKISDWLLKYHKGRTTEEAVSSTWYNQSLKKLFEIANPEVRQGVGLWGMFKIWLDSDNKAVKMLLYDWTKDPL